MTTEFDIDKLIYTYFTPSDDKVSQAMVYCLGSGGKRIRPNLLLKTAANLECVDDNICRLAVALECIHTYSLVHDDLPCMDNDDFRRGKPTCHKQFDEATAVLCGDALLNLAMEIVSGGSATDNYMKCINMLFTNSGYNGMIRGQTLDLNGSDNNDGLMEISLCKTAKMIISAIAIPAVYAGLPADEVEKYKQIGQYIGIAYQVADDLLDEKSGENSFVSVLGHDETVQLLNCLSNETLCLLDKLNVGQEHIRQLVTFNLTRKF